MIRTLGPRTDLDGLIADALEEGREVHLVRAGGTKQQTMEAFARALDFPAWFGHNLDALADCLNHLLDEAVRPWELIVDDLAVLRRADDRAYTGLRVLLAEVAMGHPDLRVTLVDR